MRIVNHFLVGLVGLVVLTGAVGLLAPTASWATLQCGDHIGPNASAFLFHDLNCSGSDPALTVEGPATLLMLGHTVDCQDTGAVGIQVIGQAAIVQGGTVTGCLRGVQVGGQGSHLIKEMTATQNSRGFALVGGSHGNTLTANTSRDNAGGFDTLSGGQSDDNEVSWNTSKNDGNGYGILGARNTIKSNTAKNYNFGGFFIAGPDAMVTQNKALGGGGGNIGFDVRGDRMTVIQNLTKANTDSGFFLGTGFSEVTVLQNTAKNNNQAGIVLQAGATDSTLLGNVALDNGTDLIDANTDCDNNTWIGNRFRTSNPPQPSCIQ